MLKGQILHVLDPHHREWVQGGVFAELRESSDVFASMPVYLPPPNSIKNLLKYLAAIRKIKRQENVLFSSLTPLENYLRFSNKPQLQNIGLWFTHKEGEFTRREILSLRNTDILFTHSSFQSAKLRDVTPAKQVEITAAIDRKRFKDVAIRRARLVWVGTAVDRKRPDMLLQLATELRDEKFLVLGKEWRSSRYWETLKSLKNVEYIEVNGALTSEILEGTDIYLMTSAIEGGPMPLIETLAAGLVPICTDTGFVRKIFDEFQIDNRLIVEPSAEVISDLISRIRSGEIFLPSNTRKKILELDFQRLANLIIKSMLTD